MLLVTFTIHERKFVESVDSNTTVKAIADSKGLGTAEKIYINGTPVTDTSKTIGSYVSAGATSCSFSVIAKTNNAR